MLSFALLGPLRLASLDPQTPARLTQKENLILAAFSVLFTINIAVSNISLQLVTIPVSHFCREEQPGRVEHSFLGYFDC